MSIKKQSSKALLLSANSSAGGATATVSVITPGFQATSSAPLAKISKWSSDEDEDGMIRNNNSGSSGSSNKSSQVVNGANGEAKISISPKKSKKSKSSIKIEIIPGGDQPKVINLEVRSSSDSSVQEVKDIEKPIRQITKVQVTTTTAELPPQQNFSFGLTANTSPIRQVMNIAERTQKLYKTQSEIIQKPLKPIHPIFDQSTNPAVKAALKDDLESHRVMYQYMFVENKKKIPIEILDQIPEEGEINVPKEVSQSLVPTSSHMVNPEVKYISALNTRRNPDLLVPGGKFLKGNLYFKGTNEEQKNTSMDEKMSDDAADKESDKESDIEFDKMIQQQQSNRYFLGENPLLKCKNCGESGHWARECPNETKRAACILCGKDTHDSFSCTEKICFKCNKVGHLAINCVETNIIKCNRCGLNGHKEIRCLKVWRGGVEYSQTQLNFLRCIECGKTGHVKCTKEKYSAKIPIDAKVKDDLDEFLAQFAKKAKEKKLALKQYVGASDSDEDNSDDYFSDEERDFRLSFDYLENNVNEDDKQHQLYKSKSDSWVKNSTNVHVPDNTYMQMYRKAQNNYGIPRNHAPKDIYCCLCSGRHTEELCMHKSSRAGNQKFQQFERVRARLNYDSFYEKPSYGGYGTYGASGGTGSISYQQRVQADPRMGGAGGTGKNLREIIIEQSAKRKGKGGVSSSDLSDSEASDASSSSSSSKVWSKKNKKHQKKKKSSKNKKSSSSDSYDSYSDSYEHYDDEDSSEELLSSFGSVLKKKQSKDEGEIVGKHRKITIDKKTSSKHSKSKRKEEKRKGGVVAIPNKSKSSSRVVTGVESSDDDEDEDDDVLLGKKRGHHYHKHIHYHHYHHHKSNRGGNSEGAGNSSYKKKPLGTSSSWSNKR